MIFSRIVKCVGIASNSREKPIYIHNGIYILIIEIKRQIANLICTYKI